MATTLSEITAAARDMATGLIKGNTADTLGAPVDLINTATKPVQEALGIYSDQPFAGSASFRKLFGMEVNDKNVAETAGSMISVGGASKAMIVGAARMEKLGKADLQKATEFLNKHPEVNPGSVFNATGVYRGQEGGMRSVLSDKGAKITPQAQDAINFSRNSGTTQIQKLDQVLDHPELFAAYPELRSFDVVAADIPKKSGSFRGPAGAGDSPTIKISRNDTNPEDLLSVVLHETQHGIQSIEKWARGGAPKDFLPKDIEKTAKAVQTAVSGARQSSDTSVQKAAERFKERFNNKIRDAHTKYENIPGEQEARFTQETAGMDAGQLATTVLNALKSGVTPQSFDTQQLPSVVAKEQAVRNAKIQADQITNPPPQGWSGVDLASAVFNMLTNPTK